MAPSLSRSGSKRFRQSLMINYAFDNYQYVITPGEADEIITKPFWDDVDTFIDYMLEINFGEPIRGSRNVKLPSTLRIYTDEEIDAMDAGIIELPTPTIPGHNINEEPSMTETNFTLTSNQDNNTEPEPRIINVGGEEIELDASFEAEFGGEFLPLYTPSMLPPYSPYTSAEFPPGISLAGQRDNVPEDVTEETTHIEATPEESIFREIAPGGNNVADNIVEGTYEISSDGDISGAHHIDESSDGRKVLTSNPSSFYIFSSRIDRRLQMVKQKLIRGIKAIAPERTFSRAQKIKKRIRRK
ncbi:hypothetical protein F5Y13DRAFT_183919 [Hypoxylon sp. FL1857]|nr:hypothetical protein F5Y13DRAFT_183919 [Hypoxylon sp. FL1857]